MTAYAILALFDIRWEHSFIKICGLLLLIDFIRSIKSWAVNKLNYEFNIKQLIKFEVEHYLRVFNLPFNDENSGCVEDYLLEAAFDKSLDSHMNILAAINYTQIICLMSIDSKWDGYYYKGWLDVVNTNQDN